MKLKNMICGGGILVLLTLASCTDDTDKKMIVCWGDSLTASHTNNGSRIKGPLKEMILGDDSYPGVLQGLLGDEYQVVNCGVGGENTLAIMARQGAYPMVLAHDVVLFKDDERKFDTFIGNNDMPAFVTSYDHHTPITPLLQGGYAEDACARVNPASIGGLSVTLSSQSKFWQNPNKKFDFEYNYFLEPNQEIHKTDTLRKGTVVKTQAMRTLRGAWCNVFFIGQNGGYHNAAELVKQVKAMIAYSRCKNYVVVSFHKPNDVMPTAKRMAEMEDTLAHNFGKHFINLRRHMVKNGLQEAGMTATQEDRDSMAHGKVPPQLMVDGCHFTKQGYQIIAKLVEEKIRLMK